MPDSYWSMRATHRCTLLMALLVTLTACGLTDAVRGRDPTDEHDMSALMRAAAAGDSAEVERLIDRGAELNQAVRGHSAMRELIAFMAWMQQLPSRDDGYTPLHYALSNRHLSLARALIAHGATFADNEADAWMLAHMNGAEGLRLLLNAGYRPVSPHGDRLVAVVASQRDTTVLRLLLEHGASPDANGGITPLMTAAKQGHDAVARLLLEAGASREARHPTTGWTPAMMARHAGHDALADRIGGPEDAAALKNAELVRAVTERDGMAVERLIADGASADARGEMGPPVLYIAAQRRDRAVVERLLAAGADPNVESVYGPVLLSAVQSGDSAMTRVLLDAGADPRTPGAASAAAARGSVELLRLLAERGTDLRAGNDQPLRSAALGGHAEAVRFLLARGASVHAADEHGRHPLGAAVAGRNLEVARILLDAGANPNQAMDTWTPLMSAAMSGDSALVELLLARGANRHALDDEGRTPAEIARRAGQERMARRLEAR